MVAVGSRNFFAGIWLTQVGDTLDHHQWGGFHLIILCTLVALTSLPVAVAKDQEVGELGFGINNITEGCRDVVVAAEGFPLLKGGVLGTLMLGSGAGG